MNNISKPAKILLGIATLWPLLYTLIYMFTFLIFTFTSDLASAHSGVQHKPIFTAVGGSALLIITQLLTYGLLIFYIVNLIKTNRVQERQKPFWAVIILVYFILSLPIYWYLYVWRRPDAPPTLLERVISYFVRSRYKASLTRLTRFASKRRRRLANELRSASK